MKTRIIYTKFWEDDYIGTLSPIEKILFFYLLTNSRIGLGNVYECADRVICFETGISEKELKDIKKRFEKDMRFLFDDGYIYVVNCKKYNQYKGEKNESAKEREGELIGEARMKRFQDRVSIGYQYPSDTSINHNHNHKSKTINHKSDSFEDFWKQYPKKVAKKKAKTTYQRLATSKKKEKNIMEGLKKYQKKWRTEKTDVKFIPNPITWLNQERWTDDVIISNDPYNKNARANEEKWKQTKEQEKRKYQEYQVEDGQGGLVKLSELVKK